MAPDSFEFYVVNMVYLRNRVTGAGTLTFIRNTVLLKPCILLEDDTTRTLAQHFWAKLVWPIFKAWSLDHIVSNQKLVR